MFPSRTIVQRYAVHMIQKVERFHHRGYAEILCYVEGPHKLGVHLKKSKLIPALRLMNAPLITI